MESLITFPCASLNAVPDGRFLEQGQAGSGNGKVDRGVDQDTGGSFTQVIVDILSSWY